MPVVQNIVKDATGAVQNGTVTIELVYFDLNANPQSFQGFVNVSNDVNADFTMNIPATLAITNGVWSVGLQGNAGIAAAYGASIVTYYKITEATANINRVYYISVPNSGGPYWTGSLGSATPALSALGALTLDNLVDVDAPSPSDGQALVWDDTSNAWVPASIASASPAGTWTPTVVGVTTKPATWSGSWEQVADNSFNVSILASITGAWSGTAITLTASLPSGWVRHATHSQILPGLLTNGTNYYNIIGVIDSLAKSNTAPTMKFLSPNSTTTSFDYRLITGVGAPISFVSGYTIEVSGVIRRG